MLLGLALTLASAFTTNVGFLLRHRGAVAAPGRRRPPSAAQRRRAVPLEVVDARLRARGDRVRAARRRPRARAALDRPGRARRRARAARRDRRALVRLPPRPPRVDGRGARLDRPRHSSRSPPAARRAASPPTTRSPRCSRGRARSSATGTLLIVVHRTRPARVAQGRPARRRRRAALHRQPRRGQGRDGHGRDCSDAAPFVLLAARRGHLRLLRLGALAADRRGRGGDRGHLDREQRVLDPRRDRGVRRPARRGRGHDRAALRSRSCSSSRRPP